jgi:hypothetical protein
VILNLGAFYWHKVAHAIGSFVASDLDMPSSVYFFGPRLAL